MQKCSHVFGYHLCDKHGLEVCFIRRTCRWYCWRLPESQLLTAISLDELGVKWQKEPPTHKNACVQRQSAG